MKRDSADYGDGVILIKKGSSKHHEAAAAAAVAAVEAEGAGGVAGQAPGSSPTDERDTPVWAVHPGADANPVL